MSTPEFRARARAWLKKNPPPKDWRGTPMQWAELEMLALPKWLAKLLERRK